MKSITKREASVRILFQRLTLKDFIVSICLMFAFTLTEANQGIKPKTFSTEEFFYQLKNTNGFIHSKITNNSSIDFNYLFNQIVNINSHKIISININLLKYASGVSNPNSLWKFQDDDLNEHIIHLFTTIASNDQQLGFHVDLSQYDLFHGHLFALYNAHSTLQDVGILFHAKEYPRDLKLGNPDAEKNSPFTTDSFEYIYRNFIWLASTNVIYNLDSDSPIIFPHFFLPEMIDVNDPAMKDIIHAYLKARTFIIDNLDIKLLGDVNCFIANDKPVIFFTYI